MIGLLIFYFIFQQGILDLTKENIVNCKEFGDDLIKDMAQYFSNIILWNPKLAPIMLQDY